MLNSTTNNSRFAKPLRFSSIRRPRPNRRHSSGSSFLLPHLQESLLELGYYMVVSLAWLLFLATFPFSLLFCIKIVHEYKRMVALPNIFPNLPANLCIWLKVIFRLGRLLDGCPRGPGVVFLLPCVDHHTQVDLRVKSYDVPSQVPLFRLTEWHLKGNTFGLAIPQEMLTKDSVTVSVDAAVYFRTKDPIAAISCIVDSTLSTKQLAQTTLRNILGTRTLTEIMLEREDISKLIQASPNPQTFSGSHKSIFDCCRKFWTKAWILWEVPLFQCNYFHTSGTNPWGIKVERVELKDIRLPKGLLRALAAEAEAVREANAKVVKADGELNVGGTFHPIQP
jgi:erythrocyte band 7 integral membrane protein